jgi:hypothetical protein
MEIQRKLSGIIFETELDSSYNELGRFPEDRISRRRIDRPRRGSKLNGLERTGVAGDWVLRFPTHRAKNARWMGHGFIFRRSAMLVDDFYKPSR